jgi:hypothetical protein
MCGDASRVWREDPPSRFGVLGRRSWHAFAKAVVVRGTNIDTVAHFGRRMSAELRTALELRPPPRLAGAVCIEEGCDRRHDLDWDHDDPVANGGVSSYENLKPRCKPDHWEKTERDRRAGLLGGSRSPPA